jgi:hypothetical protein
MICIINVQGTVGKGIRYAVTTELNKEELHTALNKKFTHEFGSMVFISYEEELPFNEVSIEGKKVDRILTI